VLVDDPLLTVRDLYRFRPLTRVLFDWRGRIPASARVLKTLDQGPIVMIVSQPHVAAERQRLDRLAGLGVSIETFDRRSVGEALARLGDRGILSLLVEGGPTLHSALADARLIDRVQRVTTPHVLHSGILAASAIMTATGSAHPTRLGNDVLIEVDVHRAG
jgi:diaminohydroxyphosphoribosylaminopyrimidine deaminase/5-amino-6-(5-phosphoribosylamino)uracil reductase